MGRPVAGALLSIALLVGRGANAKRMLEMVEEEEEVFDGWKWKVQWVPDDFCTKVSNLCDNGTLIERKPLPHVTFSELFEMAGKSQGNTVLPGPINGWGAMSNVQLQTLTCGPGVYLWKLEDKRLDTAQEMEAHLRDRLLAAQRGEGDCASPLSVRSTIAAPGWTKAGWSPSSPGFAFWFRAQDGKKVIVGEDMLSIAGDAKATKAHYFTHRYVGHDELWEQYLEYHSGVVIEWDHGRHLTLLELSWRGGLGGYKGQSNWYDEPTDLFSNMPAAMVHPWDKGMSEIRLLDVPAKTWDEFKEYMKRYSDLGQRFVDHSFPHESVPVHLFRSHPRDIARYIVNYIRADLSYNQARRNCQTFAVDFFEFVTGKSVSVQTFGMGVIASGRGGVATFTQEPLLTQ